MALGDPLERAKAAADALCTADVLELHRHVSRRAQAIRAADPEYAMRLATGRAAARARITRTLAGDARG